MLQALPESGRAVTVCLTPWRERWSLGVAPCTASRTFTVASSTWWAAGVGEVGVAAGGGEATSNINTALETIAPMKTVNNRNKKESWKQP